MKLNRKVTKQECPWLDADLPKGLEVRRYPKYTYGCIGPTGLAVCLNEDGPFFEVPRSAITIDT